MEAERTRVAKELRAQGAEAAERIRAAADRETKVLIAEAESKSLEVRGQGDAEATRLFAEAYSTDRDFFSFYRSLMAYRNTFRNKDNLMVIEPDTKFFQYFMRNDSNAVE
jgi:membrane protease subunit HflC